MLVGPVGTGKTSVAENTLTKLDTKTYSVLTVNMSAQVCKLALVPEVCPFFLFWYSFGESVLGVSAREIQER